MIVFILLISLAFSFCLQLLVIVQYLSTKAENYYRILLGTFVINTVLMIVTSVFMFKTPVYFYNLDLKLFLWIVSGFILFILLFLKITIFMRVYKRSKDPAYYTLNYFGKKVYAKNILKQSEFVSILLSMPFFLIIGSYFVARLINILRQGSM